MSDHDVPAGSSPRDGSPHGGNPEAGSPSSLRPAVGAAVPRRPEYRLVRPLGHGGFGEVWLAEQRQTGERRVFKFCFEANRARSLERELELFDRLEEALGDRDDIVRIVDGSFEEEPYFVASEFASGGDLETWFRGRGGPGAVPLGERLELVAQAADALAAAHSVGVLHGDVKPGNLLVQPAASGAPRVRLADFGVGRRVDLPDPSPETPTGSGVPALDPGPGVASTRIYEAPEVTEGRLPTVQADLYSLGVVLYQVVVGEWGRPLAPGWERDVEDELLRELVAEACAGRPERRTLGMSELAKRLRGLEAERQDRQDRARRAEEERRKRRQLVSWARRRRWTVRLGALLVLWSAVMVALGLRIEGEVERARREIATASTVSDFLVELFEGGDPADPEGGLSVLELLDRGAERARRDLAERPGVQVRLLHTIGRVYARLGHYDEAAVELREARDLYRQSGSEAASSEGASSEEADLLFELGSLEIILGDLERAVDLLQQSLDLYRRLEGPRSPGVAACLQKLGAIALRKHRLEEGGRLYREAVDILEDLPGQELSLAIALADSARYHELAGQDQEMLDALRRARDVHERHLSPDHPALGRLYATLGDSLATLERWDEAEPALLKAKALLEPRLGPDHPYLAAVLSVLGRVHLERGELDAAEQALSRSIAIVERDLGPDNLYLRSPLLNLARALRKKGDLEASLRVYERSVALGEAHLSPDDPRRLELEAEREATLAERDRSP